MPVINPYLNFKGTTEAAFNLYKSVFGGEFAMVQRFKETPEADKVSAADKDKIMHIALPIGKDNVIMGSDAVEGMGGAFVAGNNFSLSISAESQADADRIFKGLSAGGKVTMPMAKTFWGAYFGMLVDQFGVNWMVSHNEARP